MMAKKSQPVLVLLLGFVLLLDFGFAAKPEVEMQQQITLPQFPFKPGTKPRGGSSELPHRPHTMDKDDTHQPAPPPTPKPVQPNSLVDLDCVREKHTRLSCAKVFCPPWQHCIRGECVCKLPNQCPRLGSGVCGLNKRNYISLCHAQAVSCRVEMAVFSHFGTCQEVLFEVQLQNSSSLEVAVINKPKNNEHEVFLICGTKLWNMAAANVICSHVKKESRGAATAQRVRFKKLGTGPWPRQCMSVSCTGSEQSLAECAFYKPQRVDQNTLIAAVTCYTEPKGQVCNEFSCVNTKCVSWQQACDGVDDCGDNSDEMCCRGCSPGAFLCGSGVCIPPQAVQDKIRDCLGGDDELQDPSGSVQDSDAVDGKQRDEEVIMQNPKEEIQRARDHIEDQLHCGIPNVDYLNKTEEETRYNRHNRQKRVVGGQDALPTQIQWQVAIEENGNINCGGVFLGGCWVLTAAHCVRPKPKAFRVKFSLWQKSSLINTTDISLVTNIIIHEEYNSRTYRNDIALIQLEEFPNEKKCLDSNPAVRSICVPWSPMQFAPNSTCTISGWGRNKEGDFLNRLKWASVTLIENCARFYKDRFLSGMECAGDLEGMVDSCQGDSGGPLVCKDASGVSYVWGIVSWGDKCGAANSPGVYTKVAHYFEWIRFHTGWPAVTKYNQ